MIIQRYLNQKITFLLLIFLSGCNNSTNYETPSLTIKSKTQNWVTGIRYYYATNPEINAACKMDNSECITFEEYESACKDATGVTKLASSSVAMSGGIHYLFINGNIDRLDVVWNSAYQNFPCRVLMDVSGIVSGNSRRGSTDAQVRGFILNENNQILVHEADNY